MKYKQIKNQTFDLERSLYNLTNTEVIECEFKGPRDGESVLKETRNIKVTECYFELRYPLWHANKYEINSSCLSSTCRAPIWYSNHGLINECSINGIKTLRECLDTTITNCNIDSSEFGWRCNKVDISDSTINSEYLLFESKNVSIMNLKITGKYSFQYMTNLTITDSYLDTKDAFWHSKNIVIKNSVVKGEYLAWFSKNLTLIDCHIIGTQPFCYCSNLTLINCTMEKTDLSFEYSSVKADVKGHIDSVKNPLSGIITCDSVGEIIFEDAIKPCKGKVVVRK